MDTPTDFAAARPGASQRPDSLRKRTIDTAMIASMQPGPGDTKTHTSSSGEPRPWKGAWERKAHLV